MDRIAQKPKTTDAAIDSRSAGEKILSENQKDAGDLKDPAKPPSATHLPSLELTDNAKVNPAVVSAAVEALGVITGEAGRQKAARQAVRQQFLFDASSFSELMGNKTLAERQEIDRAFSRKFGARGLEDLARKHLSGMALEQVLNSLNRKDGDIALQRSAEIASFLKAGDRSWAHEKNLRDIFFSSSRQDILKMDEAFRQSREKSATVQVNSAGVDSPGGLIEAIGQSKKISPVTKEAVKILKNGCYSRSIDDTIKLADLALTHKNFELFAETMSQSTKEARSAFLAANGEEKILDAFGKQSFWTGQQQNSSETDRALELAKNGHDLPAGQVKANTTHALITSFTTNPAGVELALAGMSESERQMYRLGKELSIQPGKPAAELSPTQQAESLNYYKELHAALSEAGNSTQLVKWENQITVKGGSLVSSLAAHRGLLFNDSPDDIRADIASMSRKQWQDEKAHPERRDEMKDMLKSLGLRQKQMDELLGTYDAMINARAKQGQDDYAAARDAGKEPLTHALTEARNSLTGRAPAALKALANMSTADQERYRKDASFAHQVRMMLFADHAGKRVPGLLHTREEKQAAERTLRLISNGEKPALDIAGKLAAESDPQKALHLILKEFSKNPELREKLLAPRTDSDRAISQDFHSLIDRLPSHSLTHPSTNYASFAAQLLADGHLPLNKLAKIDSFASLGGKNYFPHLELLSKDVAEAGSEERNRLLSSTGRDFREQVFSGLDKDGRNLILNIARQGEVQPEDKVKSAMTGTGFRNSTDVSAAVKEISSEDLPAAKEKYAIKYGHDFEADVLAHLSDEDRVTIKRKLGKQLTTEEQAEKSRHDGLESRSGAGAAIADLFSGTGRQLDATLRDLNRQFAAGRASEAKTDGSMQPADLNSAIKNANTAIDNHNEARETVKEAISDTTFISLWLASTYFSGGLTLPYYVLAGAANRTAVDLLMSSPSGSRLGKDLLVGSVEGLAMGLNPSDAARLTLRGFSSGRLDSLAPRAVAKAGALSELAESGKSRISSILGPEVRKLARNAIADESQIATRDVLAAAARSIKGTSSTVNQAAALHQLGKEISAGLKSEIAAHPVRNSAIASVMNLQLAAEVGAMLTLADDLTSGKGLGEIELLTTMIESGQYQLAMDSIGLGLAGAGLLGMRSLKKVAPDKHSMLSNYLKKPNSSPERTSPAGAAGIMASTFVPDPSSFAYDADKDEDKEPAKAKGAKAAGAGSDNAGEENRTAEKQSNQKNSQIDEKGLGRQAVKPASDTRDKDDDEEDGDE
jgi:hypothetical protein